MIYIGLKALNIFNILVREVDINVLKKTSLIESSVEDEINQTYIEKLVKQVENSQIVFYPDLIMNFYVKVTDTIYNDMTRAVCIHPASSGKCIGCLCWLGKICPNKGKRPRQIFRNSESTSWAL